jgi:hypothetical protein
MKMKNILWIEDIVESTLAIPVFTNFRVDRTDFVDFQKVFIRRNAFLAFEMN